MNSRMFALQVKKSIDILRQTRLRGGESETFAWLADNHYLLESEGKSFLRRAKALNKLPDRGERIIGITEEYISACSARVTGEGIDRFLKEHPHGDSLTGAEFDCLGLCITGKLLVCAADAVSGSGSAELIAAAVTGLRQSDGLDLAAIMSRRCFVARELEREESGVYRRMDEESKAEVRSRVSAAAKKAGMSEKDFITQAKEKEGSVLHRLPHESKKTAATARSLFLFAAPLILSAVTWAVTEWWMALLLFLPYCAILTPVADTLTLRFTKPTRLLRFDPDRGIPRGGETAVVISCLLTDPACVRSCFTRIESFYRANPDERLIFGLLADLPDAPEVSQPSDRAVIKAALTELSKLEKAFPRRFFLFLRGREYSVTQRSYSGRERKRGAILDIMKFARGGKISGLLFRGDKAALSRCRFLLTLDSDTDLTLGSAAEMVCIALHPENTPEIKDGRVIKGHGIFAPRISTSLSAWQRTPFSRAMSGSGGASAYTGAVGDIYQDLYGSGLFSGKGLIDIDAALQILPSALPDNTILSHDIPEGCLLRAAFVSDVELTDGCPSSASGWLKRLHRWTRGDVQNVCLLFSNKFDALSKCKLADNIRRAVTLPVVLLCFIIVPFAGMTEALWLTVTGLIAISAGEYLTLLLRCVKRLFTSGRYSGVSPALSAARRAFVTAVTAAETGILLVDACLRALWRLLVSKRGLMEWSTAAQSDKGSLCCKKGALLGAALIAAMIFIPNTNLIMLPLAILWLTAPLAVKKWDTPYVTAEKKASPKSLHSLRNFAAAMWRFFEDNLTSKRGMLPPDNVQIEPVGDAAERTSPTNIGLMLLSVVAARDLEFISTSEMTDILLPALDTCVKLKKHRGNLYNWYSLEDMSVLEPAYLSSVDSGNFLCCLIALRQSVREYRGEDMRLWELYNTVSRLIDETDLSVFVDTKRNRLVTGLDCDLKKSSSAYDLLMSEALLTVYCGVALGQISKKIFSNMGRLCGRAGSTTGALSWTGTMFEYFMPTLLLPVFHGSLIHSSLKFALKGQKERVGKSKHPWGISESGFYGFDPTLHYQYRAHGVQKAALCRGQDADLVISPYSAFLTLSIDPDGAVRNLNRLKEKGMWGEYGFFEALDLTPSRTGGSGAVVRSFMAHHIGMSMVAAANALLNDVFVRRFMADPAMNAAQELLKERLPDAAPVYRGFDDRRAEKPPRISLPPREFDAVSPVSPRANVMHGGGLTLTLSDCGTSSLKMGETDITASSPDLISDPRGVFCVISSNGKVFSPTCAPLYDVSPDVGNKQVKFSSNETVFYTHESGLDAALSFTLSGNSPVGAVRLTLKNLTGRRKTVTSLLYFEPMLCPHGDAAAHRAFAKLFISLKKLSDGAVFSRRPGRGAKPLSLALCRDTGTGVSRLFDRQKVLSRPRGTASLADALGIDFESAGAEDENENRFFPEVCGAAKVKLSLPPYSQKSLTWYFAVDENEEKAVAAARTACRKGHRAIMHSAAAAAEARAALAGTDEMCSAVEGLILPCLLYPRRFSPEARDALPRLRAKGDGILWSLGISGDLPIILAELGGSRDGQRVKTFLRIHRHLAVSGVKSDLVFTCRDRHEYMSPVSTAVKAEINAMGLSWSINRKGGVFIVDVTDREDAEDCLRVRAAYVAPRVMLRVIPPASPFVALPVHPVTPLADAADSDGYTVDPSAFRPERPWCHILSNQVFGTLVSDKSVGHTYAFSSRDNRLTSWSNDPCSDLNGEGVCLDTASRRYSLTNGARAFFDSEKAVWTGKAADISSRVTVRLCARLPVKLTEVTLSSVKDAPFALSFFVIPPADSRGRQSILRHSLRNGALVWENMSGQLFDGFSFLIPVCERALPVTFSADRAAFLAGETGEASIAATGAYTCSAVTVKGVCKKDAPVTVKFYLGYAGNLAGADRIISILTNGKGDNLPDQRESDSIHICSDDPELDLLTNLFLPHQISACRIRARTAFWQSSGARGFRDQLQDACNEVIYDPVSARQQMIRAACRQFERGDVLHWWTDRGRRPPEGSRTNCSDDLIWLPYAVSRYIEVTGDMTVTEVVTPYISGELPGETGERFITCVYSEKSDSVYDHCLLALRRADTQGEHGLLLMGTCDWNDGLSKVGVKGRGETVWGTMFLSLVCRRFANICKAKGDVSAQQELLSRADRLDEAWKKQFDKDRYLRAYDDSGRAMGGAQNERMCIDILPQSFAAILDPDSENSRTCLDTAMKLLVDEEAGIIRLFTPPFDAAAESESSAETDAATVGYIAAYPPGVRENGGQYTHGAIWFLFALARLGRVDDTWRLTRMISPARSFDRKKENYGGEPYYMAADVCGAPDRSGQAGWTMYTGAAGWYYRLLMEELYGIRRRGDKIYVEPRLPSHMEGFSAEMEFKTANGTARISLRVKRTGKNTLTVTDKSGKNLPSQDFVPLAEGEFTVLREII